MAPQKRSAEEAESLLVGIKAVIFDIEGTTTPVSFVKETLFPYITENLNTYLDKHYNDPEIQKDITALRALAVKDKEAEAAGVVEIPDGEASKEDIVKAVAENVRWQMSNDRNTTELKQFQGHMWEEGFQLGELVGELYKEVGDVLKQLSEEDLQLYVYSCGNEQSQKLLFKYNNSDEGDLSEVFTKYFDLSVGSKTESASYKKIIAEIECAAEEVLYLTDSPEEAKAAAEADLHIALVSRPGNKPLTDEQLRNFTCIENFNELYGDEDFDDEDDLKRFQAAGDDDGDEEDEEDPDDEEEEEEEPEEGDEENV